MEEKCKQKVSRGAEVLKMLGTSCSDAQGSKNERLASILFTVCHPFPVFFFFYFSSLPVGLETSRRHIQLQNHEYLSRKEASGMERDTVKVGLARSSGATITTKIITSKENKSNKKPTGYKQGICCVYHLNSSYRSIRTNSRSKTTE